MSQWAAQTELRSRLTGPGFADVTAEWIAADSPGMAQLNPGIDAWRSVIDGASGIDVYGNRGVAVGDIDGSGFGSFYVCQPSGLPDRLYRNKGDGSFEDITEHSGTGILDGTGQRYLSTFSIAVSRTCWWYAAGAVAVYQQGRWALFSPARRIPLCAGTAGNLYQRCCC